MEPQDKNKPPFEVGDLVTTSYYKDDPLGPADDPEELNIVRRVTGIRWNEGRCGGVPSWGVQADGGEPCSHCGRTGRPVSGILSGRTTPFGYYGVNAEWFKLVERGGPNG